MKWLVPAIGVLSFALLLAFATADLNSPAKTNRVDQVCEWSVRTALTTRDAIELQRATFLAERLRCEIEPHLRGADGGATTSLVSVLSAPTNKGPRQRWNAFATSPFGTLLTLALGTVVGGYAALLAVGLWQEWRHNQMPRTRSEP